MRRTEFLITEVRKSTDTTDTAVIKDAEFIYYFNYAQKLIQNIIVKNNVKNDLLLFEETYDATASGQYTLPTNSFAKNSIMIVEAKTGVDTVNDGYRPVDRIDPSEASIRFGYYLLDNVLYLSGMNTNYNILSLRVRAFKRLPKMDKRWGRIQTVNAGVSIVLEPGYDSDINTIDDYITVVDKYGAQKRANVYIDSFSSGTLATTDALTGVTAGDYVCLGANSFKSSSIVLTANSLTSAI